MNLSKLQSEAVLEFDKQFFEMEMYFERENPSNPLKFVDPRVKIVIKQFLSDQIQKAVEETRKEYQEALVWCSGSEDFQLEGKARKGWEKICLPLLSIQSKGK